MLRDISLFPKLFLAVLLLAFVLGANGAEAKIKIVTELDLPRYLGTWYEVARFPVIYQRGCVDSKAVYKRAKDETISVTNTCKRNGKVSSITGSADVEGPGQFSVAFFKLLPLRAKYWVLWVDPDYQTAVVGEPNGKLAWILSRSPKISQLNKTIALRILKQNGYMPKNLIWNGE